MAEVKAAVTLLVHVVANRQVVAECSSLIAELEEYQGQCWAHDEWRFQQLQQRQRSLLSSNSIAADTKLGKASASGVALPRASSLPASCRGIDAGSVRSQKQTGKPSALYIVGMSAGHPGAAVSCSSRCKPTSSPRCKPKMITP